jgi:glyoxalase family protein
MRAFRRSNWPTSYEASVDRFWFTSVYFREPDGVLFEPATDGPGFTADEALEEVGTSPVLPP